MFTRGVISHTEVCRLEIISRSYHKSGRIKFNVMEQWIDMISNRALEVFNCGNITCALQVRNSAANLIPNFDAKHLKKQSVKVRLLSERKLLTVYSVLNDSRWQEKFRNRIETWPGR
jgi:hypothetical protein